jgi:hypothetical protein
MRSTIGLLDPYMGWQLMRNAILFHCALLSGAVIAAPPDWQTVSIKKLRLFYPGQASIDWVMNAADHSAVSDIVDKQRSCAKCHEGDSHDIGKLIVAGKPAGSSKTVLEPQPIPGKAGWLPVSFQAAHDGEKLYVRLEWESPKGGADKMDAANEIKATMLFDGGDTVEGAAINGCWSACHSDLRTMKNARDDKTTKYVKNADLAAGRFYDLIQFRSGGKPVDGYVADARVMEGGKSLLAANGRKEGNKWVVTFERRLAGGAPGDHALDGERIHNFGLAIHEDHAAARYHYVSLGYQFGLDKTVEGVKSYYNVVKQ